MTNEQRAMSKTFGIKFMVASNEKFHRKETKARSGRRGGVFAKFSKLA